MQRNDTGKSADPDESTGDEPATATNGPTVTRRRALHVGGLASAVGILAGAGTASAAARSGPDARPPRIVHLDYDEYDSWDDVYRMSNGDPDNIGFVTSPTYSGDTAIQLRIRENDHWGVSTHYEFDDDLLELNGRVRFALNTGWSMGGRTPPSNCRLWNVAMALGEGSAGGGVPDGTNGWSNRLYVTTRDADPDGPFHLLSNTYHMGDNGDGTGDHDYLVDGEAYVVAVPEIDPGVWYEFEYYVRVNTVDDGTANPDGVVRYWLDGDLVFEREDLRFTEDLAENAIQTTGPVGYYGGRYTAPKNLYAYYDDHSMALGGTFDEGGADAPNPWWRDLLVGLLGR